MIVTFKIVTGIYDKGSSYATRGHDFGLQKIRGRL